MISETKMPTGASKYAQSPVFTAKSVPKALLSVHSLKSGTWGKLCVRCGSVQYYLPDMSEPLAVLRSDESLIVAPEAPHFVKLSQDAVFQIEFWKVDNTST